MVTFVFYEIRLDPFFPGLPVIDDIGVSYIPVSTRPYIHIIDDTVGTIGYVWDVGSELTIVINIGLNFKLIRYIVTFHQVEVNRIQTCVGSDARLPAVGYGH